jgi:small redox-active disulfide protein 2
MKKIEILGTGCKKCSDLAETTKKVADSMQIEYELEKVTDMRKIIEYGVMSTPALVVDGEVKVYGKIPSVEDIKNYLT